MFKAATINFKEPFSQDMGRRMGQALVEELGQTPKACWLFCAPDKGLKDLLLGINDTVGTKNLIGCTTDGEISSDGFRIGSAVLGGIASDQIDFHIASAKNISQDSEQAGRELAMSLPQRVSYIQLFSDGLTGNGCAILRGMSSVLGEQVPISGGTAGDAGKFHRTWQFAGDKVLSDAAVAIGFSGDFYLGTGVRSGWSPIGLPKKATRVSGNILYELDGQPALKVYERFLGKHAEKLPAVGVEYPLGLVGKWGDVGEDDYYLLRATMSVNRQEGSITFAGEIPEGAMVRLTCGDNTSILEAAGKAAQLAMADMGKKTLAMIFVYSCMARKLVLGRRTREEIEHIRQEVGTGIPMVGFYTYGEYCRIRRHGPSLLHNETVTISVIGI
ncbi:MAG: FIST C-terminal domain-containing protein [Desulfobacteraceae bacterium]|nr:FIST C-terminal domain-containing protein [Desulfobacteraceae bacterium]MBL7205317.1 FIST C-terminal domain-containing protein [Desulfobacteraceae bacterium]